MFTFVKLIKPFLLPPGILLLGLLLGLWLHMKKRHGWGNVFVLASFLILYLLSIQPVAYLLSLSLYPGDCGSVRPEDMESAQAIVVLAGGASRARGIRPMPELSGPSWRRLWHGIELYKALDGRVPVLYSGGSGNPFDPVAIEARLARRIALNLGIAPQNFWIEERSRDTYENGLAIKDVLRQRLGREEGFKVILVTSMTHIPRAVGVLEGLGLRTIPSPSDFAIGELRLTPLSFMPSVDSLTVSTQALHEWLGILGYRLRGRIKRVMLPKGLCG